MDKKRIYLLLAILVMGTFIVACDDDGLSEEEVMELASRSSSVYVLVSEEGSGRAIEGATVTLSLADGPVSSVTNNDGVAFFQEVQQGDVLMRVSGEGYFDLSREVSFFNNGRGITDNYRVRLYSEDASATITGQVRIQTDLTTEESEFIDGLTISAFAGTEYVAEAVTDNEGNYTLIIPTVPNGRSISLNFPDVQFDQRIAVVEGTDVVVRTARGTIFKPYEEAAALPNTANIQATVGAPVSGWNPNRQAYIKSVVVEFGGIVDVELGDVGYAYSGDYTVSINSPDGGSGASIELSAGFRDEFSACSFPLDRRIYGVDVLNVGFGYPDYEPNQNVSTTHPKFLFTDCDQLVRNRTFQLRSGEVLDASVTYGTGTVLGEIE